MGDSYRWFVVIHLVGLVVFAVSHGVSVFIAFRVRRERDAATVATMLDLSKLAVGPLYGGLGMLLVGGIGATWVANLWFQPWIIASAVILVSVLAVMYTLATPYYVGVRTALAPRDADGRPTIAPDELARLLDTRRPELLVTVGGTAMVALVGLMVLKPAG